MVHAIILEYYRTIYPQRFPITFQDAFVTYLNKLIEYNENMEHSIYRHSHLESLRKTSDYFEVQNIETNVKRQNNPHYLVQQDILQITQFQYKFFQNIILNEDIIPQIRVYSQFLPKFYRFNYQLLWEEQNQAAFKNVPQALTNTELLPFIIHEDIKHPFFIDRTKLHTLFFEIMLFDTHFLFEQSETSDSRHYRSYDKTFENHYYEYDTTTPQAEQIGTFQTEQIETLHDPQDTFHGTHQILNELLKPTQQNQKTLTLDNTSTVSNKNNTDTHEANTDTHSFTVTTDSNISNNPTREIQHNNTDNENSSQQNDAAVTCT